MRNARCNLIASFSEDALYIFNCKRFLKGESESNSGNQHRKATAKTTAVCQKEKNHPNESFENESFELFKLFFCRFFRSCLFRGFRGGF